MNPCPRQPCNYPTQTDPACLKDCETRSDNGHISLIEVSERFGGGLTVQTLGDSTTCIAALLNRHLGDTRQWFSVLFEESGISHDIYVWISGNSEVVLNADAAGAVGLYVQPFTSWRGSYSCRPDDDFAGDTFPAYDNPVSVNSINTVSQAHFYAKIFQPALGRLGEL